MKNELNLFTDGSAHPQLKIGFGALLIVPSLRLYCQEQSLYVETKLFRNTSSTKLELQTLLWALDTIDDLEQKKIMIYTDSQTIISLLNRREKLEQSQYYSRNGNRLKQAPLYQHFYAKIDTFEAHFKKVKGHKKTKEKEIIDTFFTFVDRASRKALREYQRNKPLQGL